jgi:hypothetical protein
MALTLAGRVDGDAVDRVAELRHLAEDPTEFITVLRRIGPTEGPPAGRGVPLSTRDAPTRATIDALHGSIDTGAATAVCGKSCSSPRGRARRPGSVETCHPKSCWSRRKAQRGPRLRGGRRGRAHRRPHRGVREAAQLDGPPGVVAGIAVELVRPVGERNLRNPHRPVGPAWPTGCRRGSKPRCAPSQCGR